jgi:hypothetical protein
MGNAVGVEHGEHEPVDAVAGAGVFRYGVYETLDCLGAYRLSGVNASKHNDCGPPAAAAAAAAFGL